MFNMLMFIGTVISVVESTYTGQYALKFILAIPKVSTNTNDCLEYTVYFPKADNQQNDLFFNARTIAVKGHLDTNGVDTFIIADRITILSSKSTEVLNENL